MLFSSNVMNALKHSAFSILFAIPLLTSCGEDEEEKPQEACISSTIDEAYTGEIISLSSCNQNVSDYRWVIEGGGNFKELHGQSIEYTLPSTAGTYEIRLAITDSHGTSQKSFTIKVKTPGIVITENTYISDVEGIQLPNGNFLIHGNNYFKPYQLFIDNTFNKIKSSTDQSATNYLYSMQSLLVSDGVMLCGRDANFKYIDTKKLDFNGNTVWSKNNFPGITNPKETEQFVLIPGIQIGQVVAESYIKSDSKKESYISKMIGQGVPWSTKIVHTDNTTIRDAIVVDSRYVILSVDYIAKKVFVDFVDDSGIIADQKEIAITVNESSVHESKFAFINNQFVVAMTEAGIGTTIYWFDNNFNLVTSKSMGSELIKGLYETDYGYILFGVSSVARVDKSGSLLSISYFADSFLDIVKDQDGNFVLISNTYDVNSNVSSLKFIRISPAGKIIE